MRRLRPLVFALFVSSTAIAQEDHTVSSTPRARQDTANVAARASWSGRAAIPLAPNDGLVALLGPSRVGLPHDLELSFHTIGEMAPHASLLQRVLNRDAWQVAVRYGLAYPWPFLALMTGTGAGALLPADTTPPQALMIDLGARATFVAERPVLATVELALVVAPRLTRTDSPILDFPFLYPRFAALDGPLVLRASATSEGVIAGPFRWVLSLDGFVIPAVRRGFALEPRAGVSWLARRKVGLEIGGRASYARYPFGTAFHITPYLDVSVRW